MVETENQRRKSKPWNTDRAGYRWKDGKANEKVIVPRKPRKKIATEWDVLCTSLLQNSLQGW